MIEIAREVAPDFRPAARETLAAAGPVESLPSPELAPGPTRSKSRADYFYKRKTPALVNQVRALSRRGERHAAIARAIGVSPDTVHRWLDPDYDLKRRSRIGRATACEGDTVADDALLPTLPYIPGIVISGRYRMKRP